MAVTVSYSDSPQRFNFEICFCLSVDRESFYGLRKLNIWPAVNIYIFETEEQNHDSLYKKNGLLYKSN